MRYRKWRFYATAVSSDDHLGNFEFVDRKSCAACGAAAGYGALVTPEFLASFLSRRASIEEHWRTLLNIEPVSGPLANPEALQYLIPRALEEIFARAATHRKAVTLETARAELPACNCGNNPYRAFYSAGEQALTEAAVLLQAKQPAAVRRESDLASLVFAARAAARDEIDAFCGACVHRGRAKNCRFATAA